MKQILVVEDHDEFLSIVHDLLTALLPEATIFHAANGAEGLELARTHMPDLILLDLQMPVMDGYELVMTLQQDEVTKQLPVVIMTNARDAGPTLVRLSQICQGVLSKPFSLDQMAGVIEGVAAGTNGNS